MERAQSNNINFEAILQPETDKEKQILADPQFRKGLTWGVPRFGHPEGEVYKHIREVLDNIDRLDISDSQRSRLRLIAFTHDTFKYKEDKTFPRNWSRHHGMFARHFMQQYTDDTAILDILELHDEAYYSWRLIHLYNRLEEGRLRLKALLDRLGESIQLYYLFFKCDTQTGDKNQAPVKWFEKVVDNIDIVPSLWDTH
jgi:hypothetical protein